MIIIALFFLEIKWYGEEFRKLAAALIVKKLTLNTAKSTDSKSVLLLYAENHSLGEWFKRGFCRWGKIKLPLL